MLPIHLDDGDISLWIGADDLGGIFGSVIGGDLHRTRAIHDVTAGYGVTVGRDEEARSLTSYDLSALRSLFWQVLKPKLTQKFIRWRTGSHVAAVFVGRTGNIVHLHANRDDCGLDLLNEVSEPRSALIARVRGTRAQCERRSTWTVSTGTGEKDREADGCDAREHREPSRCRRHVAKAEVACRHDCCSLLNFQVHRSISPNTMSSEPMIAETSASMCPQVKKIHGLKMGK